MPRYVALLRAINVGGHTVKMDRLRQLFEELGFRNVETFIASGNVIFDSPSRTPQALERRIERHLHEALGYEVATFIRSPADLAAIAGHEAFPPSEVEKCTLYIGFAGSAPTEAACDKLIGSRTSIDEFHVNDREVYWLRRKSFSESEFSGAKMEKTLGMPVTIRNMTTVRKLATRLLVMLVAFVGLAGCSSGRGTAAEPGAAPEAVRPTVASLPENPCELLTARQVSAAGGQQVTRAHRVPDIGEIIRAEKEGRTARANNICSYDTPNEFGGITIIVPPVSEQSSAAYHRAREDYFRQFSGEDIDGIGQDAWLAGGTTLHVLAGPTAQFIVATPTARDWSRDTLIAVAKAVLARIYK
jgi:uncharacterized protein (DUF1697 family)